MYERYHFFWSHPVYIYLHTDAGENNLPSATVGEVIKLFITLLGHNFISDGCTGQQISDSCTILSLSAGSGGTGLVPCAGDPTGCFFWVSSKRSIPKPF